MVDVTLGRLPGFSVPVFSPQLSIAMRIKKEILSRTGVSTAFSIIMGFHRDAY